MPRTSTPPEPTPLWTLDDVAVHLGIHRESVRRMVAQGELRAYRYGRRIIRIDPADVLNMRRTLGAAPAPPLQ